MGTGGAIFNNGQTYGNGEVLMKGAFVDSGSGITVTHGKGWQIARSATTGCYTLTLTPSGNTALAWKALLSGSANINAPASQLTTAFGHPGFAILGEMQSDGKTVYMYTYNSSAIQAWPGATALVEFECVMSISSLNT